MRKIGSPLLSFLLCSLCTPLQEINEQHSQNKQNFADLRNIKTNIEKDILSNLLSVRERLKKSGIQINGVEVQFLNSEGDLLDQLYHRNLM